MTALNAAPKTHFSVGSYDGLREELARIIEPLGFERCFFEGEWRRGQVVVALEHHVSEESHHVSGAPSDDPSAPVSMLVTDGTTEARRYLGAVVGDLRALLDQLLRAQALLAGEDAECGALQERALGDMVLKASGVLLQAAAIHKATPKAASKLEDLVVVAGRLQVLPWRDNPDGPARQLYHLLHQYIPTPVLERAVAALLLVGAGLPGNDLHFITQSWREATGCNTPAEAARQFQRF